MNWTIRGRISASFSILLGVMVVIALVAYTRLTRITEQTTYLQTASLPDLYYASQLAGGFNLDYSLTQEYVLLEDAAAKRRQLDGILASRTAFQDLMARYEAAITVASDRTAFETFKQRHDSYRRIQGDLLQNNLDERTNREAAARVAGPLDQEFEKGEVILQNAMASHRVQAQAETDQVLAAARTAEIGIILSFAVAVLLALVCGYYLLRSIARPLGQLSTHLEQSGLQLNTSVAEIVATSQQQQVMATEVATTTLEIGATSKEISATAKELVRTMQDVSVVADQSAALAANGQTGLTQMEETMRQVMSAAGVVNTKLAVLNEKAGNIGQVVTTITKVADQTNLLSLNAAIEAEKAGEYGRGFAVVATEIRRLADQTAVSTYDIEQIVKEIQSAISAGVMSMDRFSEEVRRGMQAIEQIGGQLTQIIQHAQALAPRVESVNEGMQAQTTGAEQIAEALTQLSSAAQHTVESIRQSNVAIEGLHGLSADITRFKLQVA